MEYTTSGPKKFVGYLKVEEFKIFIAHALSPHHKIAFMLSFGAGLRISEIVNLKKEDIDLKGKRIMVHEGKGGKDRIVPLPKGFPESSLRYLPLSCGVRALQIAFKETLKRSGLNKENLHFHSLRHSFAINCLDVGMPTNAVQLLLGHADLKTTSIYTRMVPKDALDSYERLWK